VAPFVLALALARVIVPAFVLALALALALPLGMLAIDAWLSTDFRSWGKFSF
jgi:hypothetical protein